MDTEIHDGLLGEKEAQRQRAGNIFTFDPDGKGSARRDNAGWHSDCGSHPTPTHTSKRLVQGKLSDLEMRTTLLFHLDVIEIKHKALHITWGRKLKDR